MCERHACILHGDHCDSPDYTPVKLELSDEAKQTLNERVEAIASRFPIAPSPSFSFRLPGGHVCTPECKQAGGHVFKFAVQSIPYVDE